MTDREIFLDWVNNFISVEAFAAHYSYTRSEAIDTIIRGRKEHEAYVEAHRAPVEV